MLLLTKAAKSSITHDEALSFITYTPQSVKDIVMYNQDVSANNHLLNSIWMKTLRSIGLISPLALRLLSVSGFVLALISLLLFFRNLPLWLRLILALIPLSNPFLLDFFVLARSYGFSFGLMLLSIALLSNGLEDANQKKIRWSIVAAILATIGNFNAVYFFVPFFGSMAILVLMQGKSLKNFALKHLWFFVAALVAFVYVFLIFKKLKSLEQLYFGGNEWFGAHVINDQFWCLNYESQYTFQLLAYQVWQALYWILLFLPLVFLPFKRIRAQHTFQNWLMVWLIFAGSALLIEFNHRFLDSLYPIKRTALFMTLLFSLNLVSFLAFLFSQKWLKIPMGILSILLAGALFMHAATSLPPLQFREIPYDFRNTEVIQLLSDHHQKQKKPVDVSINWQVYPAFEFYRQTRQLDWLPVFKREEIRSDAEFLYLFREDFEKVDTANHTRVWSDEKEGLFLFQRNP
ncbi:hypothetical protein MASR2M44_28100 [Bacteroidota bacterium]